MSEKDLFNSRAISPMLIGESADAFDDPGYLYELKWDGERCLAYLDPKEGTELRNKRRVKMLPKVPELSELHRQVNARCILDGELMVMVAGKPDFSAIQRRSLMSNTFKIALEAKKHPATFVAFDLLYLDGKNLTMLPLTKRKELLAKTVKENKRLAVSRCIERDGIALYRMAEERGLEGIVAKRKDSIYIQGKRTKDWIKVKNLMDDDFVVCGYIRKESNTTSIVLGQYRRDILTYKGHVTLGVGGRPFAQIQARPREKVPPCANVPEGHGNEQAVWLHPSLVCTVQFMERTKNGGMRQPVFKGLREDKDPRECGEKE